ncbi:hypothetical protein H0H87_009207 [Tephrocybe sp. NHM501043]|nr:hypothetical protein H0H87_009207 [Tephrocybe sp. NHM501043]
MSLSTNTSVEVKFAHPEYFVQSGSLDEWHCSICTPPRKGSTNYMSLKAAQHHERHSKAHARNITETERLKWISNDPDPDAWDEPLKDEPALSKEEVKMRESQLHVDLVGDMVPFWIRGVEAAERGEVLRLEEFLTQLEASTSEWGGSGSGNGGWGEDGGGWGEDGGGWGSREVVHEKKRKQTRRRKGPQHNAYQFVEDVARQEAADEQRRRRMHSFFEMPTDEKPNVMKAFKVCTTMPPPLPSSLSPHICVLPSQDLSDLLKGASLPPLPHILQSFSPLPQVTTRATSLVSIPHTSFALRFSDLAEIEAACAEDEEQRAVRTIDWISARINKRCAKWTDDLSKSTDKHSHRTPWWDELRRCTEGDHVPSKSEGWNHPVSLILAVSTTSPNPLQAVAALHSRALQLPPWVDTNILPYTLIIHPENSPLSNEEAGALFNAVKKQYGLHSYLLPLALPTPPPPPVPVPALIPRLPSPPSPDFLNPPPVLPTPLSPGFPTDPNGLNTLRMSEKDIQQTARFTREFLVMSLLPWMEKCVVDWNEVFSSTRRLPSRLFSSTRRLFGSPSPSPAPTHNMSSSVSSLPARAAMNASAQGAGSASPPSQQRRLAEFATILGDLKLAFTVWETLRKEGKGGSDMLPMLSAPSPALPLHAANALSAMQLHISDPLPHEQLAALKYAVRWEAGISTSDFLSQPLEGERWLVLAAGNSEEAPSALLLAHAAMLSSRKHAYRRAALWYLSAASRLEKCGIKPLTMFFLRQAHGLYSERPQKTLSPSFWESEGQSPFELHGMDAIMSGIEHPLGRLLYTTGDVAGAVRFFLGLLRGTQSSPLSSPTPSEGNKFPGTDKVFLDDFRVAFAHFKATTQESKELTDLKLPFAFCLERQTRLRLASDAQGGSSGVWETREEQWKTFYKTLGRKEGLSASGKASVNERFWVDLVVRNPLDTEVNLSNLTLTVREADAKDPSPSTSFIEVEVIDDVVLGAKESRTVPICIQSTHAASLVITHATYEFLSLLPSIESLASRGRRLHDTPAQRMQPTYAPDVNIKVDVEDVDHKLLVDFVDDEQLVLVQGETKQLNLWFSNSGSQPIKELWMVAAPGDELWLGPESDDTASAENMEIIQSRNTLEARKPFRLEFNLNPGENIEYPILLHTEATGNQELNLLFVYREETDQFRSTRLTRYCGVRKLLDISSSARPHQSLEHMFLVHLELSALIASDIRLTQVTCMSPTWKCSSLVEHELLLPPLQSSQLVFGLAPWDGGATAAESLKFVSRKLQDVLYGRSVETTQSLLRPATLDLIYQSKRSAITRRLTQSHPHIPPKSYRNIFPLYSPEAVDFIIFWDIPSQQRSGYVTVTGLSLGAGHAALGRIIEEAENTKVKRSMYAETQKEKMEVLEAIRTSEWNTEMNPVILLLQEPATTCHDFSLGSVHFVLKILLRVILITVGFIRPCRTSMTMTIRNYSLTHKARFVLRLDTDANGHPSASLLPPPYIGRLTFRGTLDPAKSTIIKPDLWITRAGSYGSGRWSLETEVVEDIAGRGPDHVLHRYRQESLPEDGTSLTVRDIPIA